MPKVTLTVSPLVKRIFEARYGPGIPKIERRDIVYRYLQGDPLIANPHRYRALQKLLTESLTLEVSALIGNRLRAKKRRIHVGYFLHKIYQDELLLFVDAQVKAGVEAQTAMKRWMAENGVQEDDYGLDTAYTAWKRKKNFILNLKKKQFRYSLDSDPQNVNETELHTNVLYDYRDVVQAVNNYFEIGFCNLLKRDLKNKAGFVYRHDGLKSKTHTYPRKILSYLLSSYCWMSSADISKLIAVDPTLIRRYVRHIRFDVVQYPDVTADVNNILAATTHLSRTKQSTPLPVLS